jgi:uncharacterized protein (DUF1330 family)
MHPDEEQLSRLLEKDDGAPVVMLNLVKFRGTAGREAYLRYSRATMPLIKKRGGTILWAGDVEGVAIGDAAADAWDYAVLVQYPSRAAFAEMMRSAEYAEGNRWRLEGLERHVILATRTAYAKLAAAAPR